jgi:hypothetical protein
VPGLPDTRWGETCPVCGKPRGASPVGQDGKYVHPPSLHVQVAARGPGPYGWRVSTLDGAHSWGSDHGFFDPENDPEYHLCAVGHIYVVPPADRAPDVYNMCAAIGTVAGGKSYVLARMLNQDLVDACGGRVPEQTVAGLVSWEVLEGDPGAFLNRLYVDFQQNGTPIMPTGTDGMNQLLPRSVLGRGVAADLPEQVIKELLDIVREQHPDLARWGEHLRQPIVQNTVIGGRRAWNGFADLPGEVFVQQSGFEDRDAQRALRGYDSLLWVVDPVVTATFNDWFTDVLPEDADRAAVLNGSMRPSSTGVEGGLEGAQVRREFMQQELAKHLAGLDNYFLRDDGAGMRLLVAVNKVDLLHLGALGKPLEDLGGRDSWLLGMRYYLTRALHRFQAGTLVVDDQVRELFEEYLAANGVEDVQEQRSAQVAEALLSRFSEPSGLWDLVERGPALTVPVTGDDGALRSFSLKVPSLAEHVLAGLRKGNARRLLMRDLVMSAVGCGAMHALGLGSPARALLPGRDDVGDVLFFLCSPLGAVPREQEGSEKKKIRLRARGRFPVLSQQSAALSQLRLATLWKARP